MGGVANVDTMAKNNFDYKTVLKENQEIKETAKKFAEARRQKSPYAVEKQSVFIEKLAKYVEEQHEKGKPLTISGFILASGMPMQSWYEMKNGKYDHYVDEYKMLKGLPMDVNEAVTEDGEVISLIPWSEVLDRCYLLTQNEREEACVIGKAGNVPGNIFLLKAQHGLSDAPEQVKHQTNVQIVANSEMALKALEMCK